MRGFADILEESPLSPNINEKLLGLSINITNSITNQFLGSDAQRITDNRIQNNAINNIKPEKTSIQLNPNQNYNENQPLQNFEMDFRYVFEDEEEIRSPSEVFQKLNLEASEQGHKFFKGPTNKKTGYCYFYCKYRFKTVDIKDEEGVNNSKKKINSSKININCPSYYSLKRQRNGAYILKGFNLLHNHKGVDFDDLTESMKQDLNYIPQWVSIVDVVDYLEAKYGMRKLNYQKVYYHFRKIRPLLGPRDCEHFHQHLVENNFLVRTAVDSTDQALCKIIFISPVMKTNYDFFGDIILIDSTYQTNIYKAPLVTFTGIACNGKNVLFCMAFINEETYETYQWLMKNFIELTGKEPKLVVTDGDLAICKTMNNYKDKFPHFICQWHLERNIRRHFSYLKNCFSQI